MIRNIVKIVFLISTCIAWWTHPLQSVVQTTDTGYKITYTLSYQRDTGEYMFRYEDAELLVVGDKSLFQTSAHVVSDSIRYHGMDPKYRSFTTEHKYSILKDFGTDKLRHYEEFLSYHEVFYHDEPLLSSDDWILSSDTTSIDGRLCQKAEVDFGNRKWIAWFDQSIDIADGPYKFSGLPGLIIRISDMSESWVFELAKIERVKSVNIDLSYYQSPNEIDDKVEFFKKKKEILDNAVQIRQISGGPRIRKVGDTNDAELSRIHNAHRLKDNNWIELYP